MLPPFFGQSCLKYFWPRISQVLTTQIASADLLPGECIMCFIRADSVSPTVFSWPHRCQNASASRTSLLSCCQEWSKSRGWGYKAWAWQALTSEQHGLRQQLLFETWRVGIAFCPHLSFSLEDERGVGNTFSEHTQENVHKSQVCSLVQWALSEGGARSSTEMATPSGRTTPSAVVPSHRRQLPSWPVIHRLWGRSWCNETQGVKLCACGPTSSFSGNVFASCWSSLALSYDNLFTCW